MQLKYTNRYMKNIKMNLNRFFKRIKKLFTCFENRKLLNINKSDSYNKCTTFMVT
jgi:hypothetical protein